MSVECADPDKSGARNTSRAFQRVTEAYNILRDDEQRAKYDAWLRRKLSAGRGSSSSHASGAHPQADPHSILRASVAKLGLGELVISLERLGQTTNTRTHGKLAAQLYDTLVRIEPQHRPAEDTSGRLGWAFGRLARLKAEASAVRRELEDEVNAACSAAGAGQSELGVEELQEMLDRVLAARLGDAVVDRLDRRIRIRAADEAAVRREREAAADAAGELTAEQRKLRAADAEAEEQKRVVSRRAAAAAEAAERRRKRNLAVAEAEAQAEAMAREANEEAEALLAAEASRAARARGMSAARHPPQPTAATGGSSLTSAPPSATSAVALATMASSRSILLPARPGAASSLPLAATPSTAAVQPAAKRQRRVKDCTSAGQGPLHELIERGALAPGNGVLKVMWWGVELPPAANVSAKGEIWLPDGVVRLRAYRSSSKLMATKAVQHFAPPLTCLTACVRPPLRAG